MGRRKISLTGQTFGRLSVISEGAKQYYWLCKCSCGSIKEISGGNLRSNSTSSCGCLQKELRSDLRKTHGHKSNGQTSAEYVSWQAMKGRCCNPRDKDYKDYGGRGIKVCERWLESFENFYKDMGKRPAKTSLDRTDNDKGYSTENCRWATNIQQGRNQRLRGDNTSGVKGVNWNKKTSKWEARISVDKERISLGSFTELSLAIKARKEAEKTYW